MKTYIITLDKNFKDTDRYKQLISVGLNPEICKGVIPTGKQLSEHKFMPKSCLGCYLAHKNVWELIKSNKDDRALILEDDVTPLFTDFNSINLPKGEIIKLHSDVWDIGSNAAYIMSKSSATKILSNYTRVFGHVDVDMYLNAIVNKVKITIVESNYFKTDEVDSNNRCNMKDSIIINILNRSIILPRGEKTMGMLQRYPIIRIYNVDLTGIQFLTLSLLPFLLCKSFKNKNYLIAVIIIIVITHPLF